VGRKSRQRSCDNSGANRSLPQTIAAFNKQRLNSRFDDRRSPLASESWKVNSGCFVYTSSRCVTDAGN
jgi:hypothetical protein